MEDKKIVVITGASSPLGEALAIHFSKQGHLCCVLDCCKDALEALLSKCLGEVHAYPVDVSKSSEVENCFEKIIQNHGGIDVLMNGAEILHGPGRIDHQEISSIDAIIDTNLKGTMYCSYCAISHMMKNGGGNIINLASTAALQGYGGHIKKSQSSGSPFFGDYGSSKWGITGFGESMTDLLREFNISMTTLSPGMMASCESMKEEDRGNVIDCTEVVALIDFILSRKRESVLYRSIVFTPSNG